MEVRGILTHYTRTNKGHQVFNIEGLTAFGAPYLKSREDEYFQSLVGMPVRAVISAQDYRVDGSDEWRKVLRLLAIAPIEEAAIYA